MIKVPETEYHTLLSLLKSFTDPLKVERALLDVKMKENLNDPNIDEHLKALRDAQMFKEKRALNKIIEDKPQKVVIENLHDIPNIAPWLGISKPTRRVKKEEEKSIYSEIYNEEKPDDEELTDEEEEEEEQYTDAEDERILQEENKLNQTQEERELTPPQFERLTKNPKIQITPNKRKELEKIINKYRNDLPITTEGRIIGINGQPVSNSSYRETLDYYEGKRGTSPKGKYFFERKLLTIPEARKLLNLNQHGSGKKRQVLIKLKPIKTIGLVREKQKIPFKPRLWARL